MDNSNQNLQTARSSNNGLTTSKTKLIKLGGLINKIRVVQGWNMLAPGDTEPVSRVWAHQLDRYEVAPELYDSLLDRAIDHRLQFLKAGEQPPALTIELLLTMFEGYRAEKRAEYNKLFPQSQWHWREEQVASGELQPPRTPDGEPYFTSLLAEAETRHKRPFKDFEEFQSFVRIRLESRPEQQRQFWLAAYLPSEIKPDESPLLVWKNG
jgi:hypothetical protein